MQAAGMKNRLLPRHDPSTLHTTCASAYASTNSHTADETPLTKSEQMVL